MGLKIFIDGLNLHTGRLPMAVSSGLKRSHRASQCNETLGAERIRASHLVSKGHETPDAEHIRASRKSFKVPRNSRRRAHPRVPHGLTVPRTPRCRSHPRVSWVSTCHGDLGAEYMRAPQFMGASHVPSWRRGSFKPAARVASRLVPAVWLPYGQSAGARLRLGELPGHDPEGPRRVFEPRPADVVTRGLPGV